MLVRLCLLLLLAASVLSCKPTAQEATGAQEPVVASSGSVPGDDVSAVVGRYGFARHLPADTEGFITSLNVPTHLAALRATAYFSDIAAYLEDKTPAPSTQPTQLALSKPFPIDSLIEDEAFLALGKGGAKALGPVRELTALIQEAQYRSVTASSAMVAGVMDEEGAAAESETSTFTNVLSAILSDPTLLGRAQSILEELEVPPLMLGIKARNPDALLRSIFDAESEQRARELPGTKVFKVSSALGGHFTLVETQGATYLSSVMVADLLARLPTEPVAQATALRDGILRLCATLQGKTLCTAYGTIAGHVIIAIGSRRPALEFVSEASASLLAQPGMAFPRSHTRESLLGAFYLRGAVLDAMHSTTPLLPAAQGFLSGLGENETLAAIPAKVQPLLEAYATAAHAKNLQQRPDASGVLCWDNGLRLETRGGADTAPYAGASALKYASLLTDPGVLFGLDLQMRPADAAKLRATLESATALAYTVARELVQAGAGGEKLRPMSTLVDQQIVPPLRRLYEETKPLGSKALGNEMAWIFDLGGSLAPVPGVGTEAVKPGAPMLRIIGVYDLANRAEAAKTWQQMSDIISSTAEANPFLFGARPRNPEAKESYGFTHHSYALPLPSPDLFPCVSINDKALLLGSSKTLNEETAQHLLHVRPSSQAAALRWRLSLAKVRQVMKTFSPLLPKPQAKGEVKSLSQWLAPFEDLSSRLWVEAGGVRTSTTWQMHDVLRYE